MNLTELLDSTASRWPQQPALVEDSSIVSYAQLVEKVDQLAARLKDVKYQLHEAAALADSSGDTKGANLSDTPLYLGLLIALLLGEQLLAYSTSYHAPVREVAA